MKLCSLIGYCVGILNWHGDIEIVKAKPVIWFIAIMWYGVASSHRLVLECRQSWVSRKTHPCRATTIPIENLSNWPFHRGLSSLLLSMNGSQRTACFAIGMQNYTFLTLNSACFSFDTLSDKHCIALHACKHEVADKTRKHRRTDNMQFLVWPVHRTFARQ